LPVSRKEAVTVRCLSERKEEEEWLRPLVKLREL
jgi:hypothetical protein